MRYPDHVRLALLGQAIGDCFGAPFEYHKRAPFFAARSFELERYLTTEDVQQRTERARLAGLHTDDTQQALVLLLARARYKDGGKAAGMFQEVCKTMAQAPVQGASFGAHRGTGRNFRQAIMDGQGPDTAGLGAAMRIGPVATWFDDPQAMVDWVLKVSWTTTVNPVALASAAKFATVAWVLAHPHKRPMIKEVVWPREYASSEVWAATTAALRTIKQEDEETLLQFARMTGWPNKRMDCAANGFALTGFAWAVNCALIATSFSDALLRACSSGGDTDTVGAMAGCLAALRFGREGIPDWMIEGLHGREAIENLDTWMPHLESQWTQEEIDYRESLQVKQYKNRWTASPVARAVMATMLDKAAQIKAAEQFPKGSPERKEAIDFITMAHEAQDELEAKTLEPVLFYGPKKGLYWPFSNFYPSPIQLDGKEWPTVEHYYMAQKNLNPTYQEEVRQAPTPGIAKRMGRQVQLQDGWDDLKYDVMLKAVLAKFKQHFELRQLLLSTENRPIHEDCKDPWWGGGPNHPGGRNWLGDILVEVRRQLRGS